VFAGKRVLLVGGGDSAFDWAVNLQGVARFVIMNSIGADGFRAHAATVRQGPRAVRAGKMELPHILGAEGDPRGDAIEAVTIFNTKRRKRSGSPSTV